MLTLVPNPPSVPGGAAPTSTGARRIPPRVTRIVPPYAWTVCARLPSESKVFAMQLSTFGSESLGRFD